MKTAEKVKKAIRDDGRTLTEERREAIAADPGDVLRYVAQPATEAGLDLEELAESNLDQLGVAERRSVLHGSGDTL